MQQLHKERRFFIQLNSCQICMRALIGFRLFCSVNYKVTATLLINSLVLGYDLNVKVISLKRSTYSNIFHIRCKSNANLTLN